MRASKRKILLVLTMLGIAVFAVFLISNISNKQDVARDYFISNDMKQIYHMSKNGKKDILVINEHDKSSLRISPNKEMLGYFQDLHAYEEEIDYENNPLEEEKYWDNYTGLFVLNTHFDRSPREIYRGDYKVRNWEWIDDDRVIIYRSCGSPCDSYTIVNTDGYIMQGPAMLGLGHELSPNRRWLAGYASWPGEVGVRVRNLDTQEEYEFIHTGGKHYHYAEYVEAVWSDDNSELAILNKKKGEQNLEAALYDVASGFQPLHQETIECEIIDDDLICDLEESPREFLAGILKRYAWMRLESL